MAKLAILLICVSLVIPFVFPQISFAREWVRSKYTSNDSSESSMQVPSKVRRLMASRFNSKVFFPGIIGRLKGKVEDLGGGGGAARGAESYHHHHRPSAIEYMGIERWLRNCGLTWFDLDRKGFIIFFLQEKCQPM